MRDAAIIGAVCVLAILLGGWLFFFETGPTGSSVGSAVLPGAPSYRVIAEGNTSGNQTARKNYLIETNEQFAKLWADIYPIDPPSLPEVDFEKNDVIAVFDGTHSSGGYDIEISSIKEGADARMVTIRHTIPGEGCATTQAMTSPFQIVVAPHSDLKIARTDEEVATPCR